jgi:hypothetical protein
VWSCFSQSAYASCLGFHFWKIGHIKNISVENVYIIYKLATLLNISLVIPTHSELLRIQWNLLYEPIRFRHFPATNRLWLPIRDIWLHFLSIIGIFQYGKRHQFVGSTVVLNQSITKLSNLPFTFKLYGTHCG